MPADPRQGAGRAIAAARRVARLTQRELADASGVSYGMVRAVERGARLTGNHVLEAVAAALGVDPSRLLGDRGRTDSRVHDELPELSRVIATYDVPDDGPVRPKAELHTAVSEAVNWRVGAQYLRIARHVPPLLGELSRALHSAPAEERARSPR